MTTVTELDRAARILRAAGSHSDYCTQHSDHSGDCTFTADDTTA